MRLGMILLTFVALCSAAFGQSVLPAPDLVGPALDQHPMVVAARARVGAAEAEARALAKGPHETTLSTTIVNRTVDLEGRYTEYDAQLSRAMRLPGKARLDRAIGAHGVDAARNRAEDARHQAALLLADIWWDWLEAEAEARIDAQLVDAHARLARAMQRREALGDAARLDSDQADAALATAQVALEQSQGRSRRAKARLQTQFPGLALPPQAPDVPDPVRPDDGWEPYRALILRNSHEIGSARADAARSLRMADRARRDKLADPVLGVRVFSERDGMERGGGLVVTLPFGGGHRSALADRAVGEASAAQADLQLVEANVAEVAATDIAEADYRHSAWQRARAARAAQDAALAKMRRAHDLGEVGLMDLLTAERLAADALRAESAARMAAHRADTRVKIDSHTLWLAD